MANSSYKKATDIAYFQQMLPQLLKQAQESQFESKKETGKQTTTLQENLEKILKQFYDEASKDRMRSQKTVLDKINPIANYSSAKSSAKMQKEMLRAIGGKQGLKKYKNSVFQEGIKDSTKSFESLADTIDPEKAGAAAGISSIVELADVASKISGVAGGVSEIAKVGLKPFLKAKLTDVFKPLTNIKGVFENIGKGGAKNLFQNIGKGGVKDAFKNIGEGGFKDLATSLAENFKGHEKSLKKLGRKGIEFFGDKQEKDSQGLTEKHYYDPSDYFKYITQNQKYNKNRYL